MKNVSVDIVKDNKYYIKSPFNGEVIRFFVEKNDNVEKDQLIAVLKSNNGYVEIESEYSGSVSKICVDIDAKIAKWQDIMILNVDEGLLDDFTNIATSVESPDYAIIYTFQQEILPKLLYTKQDAFLNGITSKREDYIFQLLKEVYKNNDLEIPFSSNPLIGHTDIIDDEIVYFRIDWPNLNGNLLSKRIYILINTKTSKTQYFTCEKSLEDDLMLSCIFSQSNHLTRYNYGQVPDDLNLEKEKVIDIFTND